MKDYGFGVNKDIDDVLCDWPFHPSEVSARVVRCPDGRYVIQMRVDLGVLQMEVKHRPDGRTPSGFKTYLAYLKHLAARRRDRFHLGEKQMGEALRELNQFANRRLCWLSLGRYNAVVRDCDHSLSMMNFLLDRSTHVRELELSEKDRPLVLLHRTQAATMLALRDAGPFRALEEVGLGIRRLRETSEVHAFSGNGGKIRRYAWDCGKYVEQLETLRNWVREHYGLAASLEERLQDAIREEKYELAGEIRDMILKYRRSELPLEKFSDSTTEEQLSESDDLGARCITELKP